MKTPHIAILGAGPIGLEAALAAAESGWSFTLYERSPQVAGNMRGWGHVRLFSPWSLDASPRMRARLADGGVELPPDERCPTGHELCELLLDPIALLPEIAAGLRLGVEVLAVSRQGRLKNDAIGSPDRARTPFRLLIKDVHGTERIEHADLVLDCTGTFGQPNRLGDGGIPAPGERLLDRSIRRSVPDFANEGSDWAGKRTLLVGAGHSAQTAAVGLAGLATRNPQTRVLWALRSSQPRFAVDLEDPLPERSRLAARALELASGASAAFDLRCGVVVEALDSAEDGIAVTLRSETGGLHTEQVDRILSLTGYVGDHHLYRQLQVHECWATSGPMKLAATLLGESSSDCLAQSSHGVATLIHPEPGLFILGAKSYGRNNSFLMRVGWQQVAEVFEHLRKEIPVA